MGFSADALWLKNRLEVCAKRDSLDIKTLQTLKCAQRKDAGSDGEYMMLSSVGKVLSVTGATC